MAVYPERRKGRLTGQWIAEVTIAGERRRKRFETQRDGERWADFAKATGALPVEAVQESAGPAGPTVGEVAAELRENRAVWDLDRDPSRWQRLDYVVNTLGKANKISVVDASSLDKIVKSLKGRPGRGGKKLSAGTINRYLTLASALLDFAVKRKYRPDKPEAPWQKETGARLHWLGEEGEAKVLKALEGYPASHLAVRVLIATGMRWSEFATLEPDQIDGTWIRLWKTKTNNPRSVPIDTQLAKELLSAVRRNSLVGYSTLRKRLRLALQSAGQNPAITIHALRHTTATRLTQAQVNLRIVQRYMGHKSIQTTTRYAHVADEDLQIAAKKLSPRAGQSGQIVVSTNFEESPDFAETLENIDDRCRVQGSNLWPTVYKTDK